jgi:hypothetical protein
MPSSVRTDGGESTHRRALRLQKRIFRSLKSEASHLLGRPPASILKYEKENQGDFKVANARLTAITKTNLLEVVRQTDVTFIADFHTFDQAQRTALRIIRDAISPEVATAKTTWYIGLELIPSQFQNALDNFQAGKITLELFHKLISYDAEWGFQWSNYEPIFAWAREHQIRIIALNRPRQIYQRREEKELLERDQWAAGIITDLFHGAGNRPPRPKMIVLYGELHIGTKHLPHQITKISRSYLHHPISWVTIHQNEDRLFWKLAEQDREIKTEALKLKKNVYCVFSSTPWAKLQSLVSWIEGGFPNSSENEQDDLSIFSTYGKTIAEFLDIAAPTYESVHVFTLAQADFLENWEKKKCFTPAELKLIRFHVTHNQRIYIPRAGIAYLGSSTHNGTAELAAIHLLRTKNNSVNIFTFQEDDFFRLILEATFGFFGSLILNPRRKCDLYQDHLNRLKNLEEIRDKANSSRPKEETFPGEKVAREITVGILRKRTFTGTDLKTWVSQRSQAPALMMAARYLGQICGKKLHQAVLDETVQIATIRDLFISRPDRGNHFYAQTYGELGDLISPIETAPSKLDFL